MFRSTSAYKYSPDFMQSQTRTNIIPIDRGTKYKDKFYERGTEDENIQRVTGGCI